MKRIEWMLSFGLVLTLFAASANAESPREQLKQMVGQLQKSPDDNALREKIIKLAQKLKPAPAIPEEARRSFVRGNTALSEAKGQDDYARAVQRYEDALVIAPWWGDAYFNLAKAQELQQEYGRAARSLKLFVLTGSSSVEVRKTQDYIYVLEDKQEKLMNEKAEQQAAAEKQAQSQRLLENFRGVWYGRDCNVGRDNGCNENEAKGTHWSVFKIDGPIPLTFELPSDGTVKMNSYAGWAKCWPVSGIPQGSSFGDIRWEERPKDGPARQIYSEISSDGNWLKISCDRPLSGADPSASYHYVIWTRTPD